MSITYNTVTRQVALRINAITGATSTALETAYATVPVADASFISAVFPQTAIEDSILNKEGEIAEVIANVGNSPLRIYLKGTSGALVDGADLPSLDADSKQIIGVWGSVRDSTSDFVCREKSLAEIQRRVRNANTAFLIPVYWFKFDDRRIYHTRTAVTVDCCVYSRSAQQTILDANGAMLLPDSLADVLICGVVSELVRDDEWQGQARIYRSYYEAALLDIRSGYSSVTSKATPGPSLIQPAA